VGVTAFLIGASLNYALPGVAGCGWGCYAGASPATLHGLAARSKPSGFKRRAASGKTVIIFNVHQNLNHEKKNAILLASGKCPQVL
jgi:hypothetical protein